MRILSFLCAILAACSLAASTMAGWQKYPALGKDIDQLVETSSKVYYLSGSNLFSFCPDDQESYAYSDINILSDTGIDKIFYNYGKRYLLIAYQNANIDILYDNGKLVNLPEIKDAQLTEAKVINDVAFGNDCIAVATSFGIVIYDDKRMEVRESGIYGKNIPLIAIMNNRLVIYAPDTDTGRYLWTSPLDERHNSFDKFHRMGGTNLRWMTVIKHPYILAQHNNGTLRIFQLDLNQYRMYERESIPFVAIDKPQTYADGVFAFSDTHLATTDGEKIHTTALPAAIAGQKIAIRESATTLWCGNPDGIAQYDISTSAPTVLYDRMIHPDAATCQRVGHLRWSQDNQRLYVSNVEASDYRSYVGGETSDYCQTTNIISDGFITDVSLMQASADHVTAQKKQAAFGDKRMYGDPNWIVEDPDDPDIYYVATNLEGVYVCKYDEPTQQYREIGKYTFRNSALEPSWSESTRAEDVNIDPEGNLWVGSHTNPAYVMLPAEKRRLGPDKVTASDWKVATKIAPAGIEKKDMMSLFCKKSQMAFFISSKYEAGLVAVDTKGTYSDLSDDVAKLWRTYTDQDGNTFAPSYITFVMEDRRGCVWVGTNAGIFEITDPQDAISQNMVVKRMKVARNDGTIYADYLLGSEHINYMCQDPSGRKWIATESSGIFLVSEAGDEIIRNYHSDNSPLPTNAIASVACDPHNNTVYVGTYQGLYSFLSDATPAAEDFSNIYAYPNPVRPDYYGDVTITGLMDNSVVKITDQAGNVVYETRAQGGMATWPVCNAAGDKVRSGVYYALAIYSDGTSSAGKPTKILVIN